MRLFFQLFRRFEVYQTLCDFHKPSTHLEPLPKVLISSHFNRLALARDFAATGIEMVPCSARRNARPKAGEPGPRCIVGPRSGRCSEYVWKDYSKCDAKMSKPEWARLREIRDRIEGELGEVVGKEIALLHELAKHRSKKLRLQKQLKFAQGRQTEEMAKEIDALDEVDELEREIFGVMEEEQDVAAPSIPFSLDKELEMFPDCWNLVDPGEWWILCEIPGGTAA
uniref:Env n=1 Tax=Cercospora beticola metavirus 1 TaxID=2973208 RepID=A0A976SHX5_9VIRU|nr:env [Cercospora beticola metavirus 1]